MESTTDLAQNYFEDISEEEEIAFYNAALVGEIEKINNWLTEMEQRWEEI
ncbi:MAG: hypothetical protein OEV66_09485 [Spirochaetia bacterium]|nr:hypothetical protein [Spirochaetia bacterium]